MRMAHLCHYLQKNSYLSSYKVRRKRCVYEFRWLPGTPTRTCARCRPHRRCLAPRVPRVAACPHTPARSPSTLPQCRKSPRPAAYPLDALRGSQNVEAHGYFGKLVSSLPFYRCGRKCEAVALFPQGLPTRRTKNLYPVTRYSSSDTRKLSGAYYGNDRGLTVLEYHWRAGGSVSYIYGRS